MANTARTPISTADAANPGQRRAAAVVGQVRSQHRAPDGKRIQARTFAGGHLQLGHPGTERAAAGQRDAITVITDRDQRHAVDVELVDTDPAQLIHHHGRRHPILGRAARYPPAPVYSSRSGR
jgi:hypothetical protein